MPTPEKFMPLAGDGVPEEFSPDRISQMQERIRAAEKMITARKANDQKIISNAGNSKNNGNGPASQKA